MARIIERLAKDGTKRYAATVRLKGYPIQSATFKRKTDANKWIQDTESAIREGRHFKTVEAKKRTIADAINRYIKDVLPTKPKLQSDQTTQLEWFKNEIGDYTLADLTAAMLAECRDKLLTETGLRGKVRTASTVNRYLAAFSAMLTTAKNEWHWITESPISNVKKPTENRSRVRYLSDDERTRLLAACQNSKNKYLHLCVSLALATGMRQSELMLLNWRDVNLTDGYIILHETKNGERRRVPVTGRILEQLKNHAKVRRIDTALLFPSSVDSTKPVNLRKTFNTALKQAEIEDFHWHDLRHCTASYLAMNGASLAEIAEILGHKTLSMVKRYSHLSDSHVSNVVASMNNKIFGAVA